MLQCSREVVELVVCVAMVTGIFASDSRTINNIKVTRKYGKADVFMNPNEDCDSYSCEK